MRFTFESQGLRLSGSAGGPMVFEAGGLRLDLDANAAAALAEAFAAAASLAELGVMSGQTATVSPRAAAARAPKPVASERAAAPTPKAAVAKDGAPSTSATADRAAAAMSLAGEPVKRGPRASAERAGVRKGKRPGRKPASVLAARAEVPEENPANKRGPIASAERAGPTPRAAAAPSGGRQTRGRKPLVDTMAGWMDGRAGPHSVEALVEAAVAEGWTAAKDVAPAIRAALGRRADLFARQPDGSFVLRANLPAGRVVRRRPGEKRLEK